MTILVFVAGEDLKAGEPVIQSVDDGKIYKSTKDRTGIVLSSPQRNTKEGDSVELFFSLPDYYKPEDK